MDIISEFENGDVIACIDGNDKPLYTAAPDLLAALYEVLSLCDRDSDIGRVVITAINKAKGN